MRVGHFLNLRVSKCLGVGHDVTGAPQSQHNLKARELGRLKILMDYIHDMSWMCNFHSGILNCRDRHIVDIYVQGLGFGCDMTALGYVSWECP